ncbi:MAG: DMT family transporter [Granulosicoccaceae bacterium]
MTNKLMNYLALFAFSSGIAISAQAAMNAQLGSLLKNPLLATCIAFASSVCITLLAAIVYTRELPSPDMVRAVPLYLWIAGGMLSAVAVSLFYFLIPQMGIGPMMSFALSGQILAAVIAGHFGWFDLPVKPITPGKLVGVIALVTGVVLLNRD